MRYRTPLIMTVHGIRTHGRWQKLVPEAFGKMSEYASYDYDYFGLAKLLSRSERRRQVENFRLWYEQQLRDHSLDVRKKRRRPSIIAHSFGTHLVGHAMMKYTHIRFDKIILCGSILPVDFSWRTLFANDQVDRVLNDRGLEDIWAAMAGKFLPDAGPSGRGGFADVVEGVVDQRARGNLGHSDFFSVGRIRSEWRDFLLQEPREYSVHRGGDIFVDRDAVHRITAEALRLDRRVFAGVPHFDEIHLPDDLPARWIRANPNIYTLLIDDRTRQVQGYINAMPLKRDVFDKVKRGELSESEICEDDVEMWHASDDVYLYLMSIAIAPEAREAVYTFSPLVTKLVDAFVNWLTRLACDQQVRVLEVAATAVTSDGRRICEKLAMKEIARTRLDKPVYFADLRLPDALLTHRVFASVRALGQAYRELDAVRANAR